MPKKKRRIKIIHGHHTESAVPEPEPEPLEYVFEWKEEGQGWKGRIDYKPNSNCPPAPWGRMVIEPKGGLHGGWVWKFKWATRVGDSWSFHAPTPGWVTGEHEDPAQATADCETCLRALLSEEYRKRKEWWDALPDESSAA